jgi:hypothetical protein
VVMTAVGFTWVETTEAGDTAFQWTLGALQWASRAAVAWARGRTAGELLPVAHVADVEDLVALPSVLVALWAGQARTTTGPRA